jgi:hypothetical protein
MQMLSASYCLLASLYMHAAPVAPRFGYTGQMFASYSNVRITNNCIYLQLTHTGPSSTQLTLLSQRKLALTARNILLNYKIIGGPKKLKNGPSPYLDLELTMSVIKS